jgi:hypothetical protein
MTVIRILTRTATAVLAVAAVSTLTACGSPAVTKSRLEGSVAPSFANLYVQRAAILGESGVTVARTHAKASCDRGGPKVKDVGPGADWICMIKFVDDKGKPQEGKFEVQAKANSTFVAGGPSKLMGLPVLTDKRTGKDIPNPTTEWDGAFDPNS